MQISGHVWFLYHLKFTHFDGNKCSQLSAIKRNLIFIFLPSLHYKTLWRIKKSQTKRQEYKILQEKNTALVTMRQLSWKAEKSDRWTKALGNHPMNNSQWVNNLSLVIQLTSSEGSAEEDFVDDVTEDFLAPSSWKGIVALLWRSVFMKHLLARI